jgi:hypothetical protein
MQLPCRTIRLIHGIARPAPVSGAHSQKLCNVCCPTGFPQQGLELFAISETRFGRRRGTAVNDQVHFVSDYVGSVMSFLYPVQNLSFLSDKALYAVLLLANKARTNARNGGRVLWGIGSALTLQDQASRFMTMHGLLRATQILTTSTCIYPMSTIPDAPIAAFISSLFYYLRMSHNTV